jgi:hypothetical protein
MRTFQKCGKEKGTLIRYSLDAKSALTCRSARQINSADGWFPSNNDIIGLPEDQLEEASAWAVKRSKENRKFDKIQYFIAMILSFLMVPFAFSGLLEPRPFIAWIGQFGIGVIFIISGIYFLKAYLRGIGQTNHPEE